MSYDGPGTWTSTVFCSWTVLPHGESERALGHTAKNVLAVGSGQAAVLGAVGTDQDVGHPVRQHGS
jgi:hypothetical protein